MPGKRLVSGMLVLAAFAASGCCQWCRKHCSTATASYPAGCCVPVCCPAPAPQQACQPATTYAAPQQPAGQYPQNPNWGRSYAAPACVCP